MDDSVFFFCIEHGIFKGNAALCRHNRTFVNEFVRNFNDACNQSARIVAQINYHICITAFFEKINRFLNAGRRFRSKLNNSQVAGVLYHAIFYGRNFYHFADKFYRKRNVLSAKNGNGNRRSLFTAKFIKNFLHRHFRRRFSGNFNQIVAGKNSSTLAGRIFYRRNNLDIRRFFRSRLNGF